MFGGGEWVAVGWKVLWWQWALCGCMRGGWVGEGEAAWQAGTTNGAFNVGIMLVEVLGKALEYDVQVTSKAPQPA